MLLHITVRAEILRTDEFGFNEALVSPMHPCWCLLVRRCSNASRVLTDRGAAVMLPIGGTVALQCDCALCTAGTRAEG